MMPIWVAVLGRIFLGERVPRLASVGIVVGFLGVAILVAPSLSGGVGALDPIGLAAVLISPIAWASGSLFASHRAVLPKRPLVATGVQIVIGGFVLFGMSGLSGEFGRFDPAAVSLDSVIAVAYLLVLGSLVAFTVYGWLMRVAPLPLIATYAFVNPVVAVILGALVLGETIDLRTAVAGAVIVFAVAVIVTARSRMPAPRRTTSPAAQSPDGAPAAIAVSSVARTP